MIDEMKFINSDGFISSMICFILIPHVYTNYKIDFAYSYITHSLLSLLISSALSTFLLFRSLLDLLCSSPMSLSDSFSDSFDDSVEISMSNSFDEKSPSNPDSFRQSDSPAFSFSNSDSYSSSSSSLTSGRLLFSSSDLLTAFTCDQSEFFIAGGSEKNSILIHTFSSRTLELIRSMKPEFKSINNNNNNNEKYNSKSKSSSFEVSSLSVSGSFIASGSNNGEICLLDRNNGSIICSHTSHVGRIAKLSLVNDEQNQADYCDSTHPLIYSIGFDGYFLVYSTLKRSIIHSYTVCSCPLTALLVAPNFPHIVFLGSFDGSVRKINLAERKCVLAIKTHANKESPVRNLAFAPSVQIKKKSTKKKADTNKLSSTNEAGELDSMKFSQASESGLSTLPMASEYPDDHLTLFISHGVGEMRVLDTRTGLFLADVNNLSPEVGSALLIAGGRNRIFIGDDTGAIRILNKENFMALETLNLNQESNGSTVVSSPVIALHAIPHLNALISVSLGGSVRAFDLESLEFSIEQKLKQLEEGSQAAFYEWLNKKLAKKGKKGKGKKGKSKKSVKSTAADAAATGNLPMKNLQVNEVNSSGGEMKSSAAVTTQS